MTTSGTYLVYKITNAVNGNFYIGITGRPLGKRWTQHVCAAKRGNNYSRISKAIRKHGRQSFLIEVIETHDCPEDMKAAEIRLISEMKPAYNITKGGDGSPGHTMSQESRQAARLRALGNKLNLGRKWTDEQKAAMSAMRKGCAAPRTTPLSEFTRAENMRRSAYARRKSVICLSNGKIYDSIVSASAAYGLDKSNVSAVCLGKRKTAGRMKFAYVGAE